MIITLHQFGKEIVFIINNILFYEDNTNGGSILVVVGGRTIAIDESASIITKLITTPRTKNAL